MRERERERINTIVTIHTSIFLYLDGVEIDHDIIKLLQEKEA